MLKITYKNNLNFMRPKGRDLLLILLINLILANSSTANSLSITRHPSSRTLRSMARVYMAYGEYAKAQPFAEKALKLARKKGTSDLELAMSFIDLATLYKNQNKLKKKKKMCQSGLELQKKVLYKNHPHLAYTLSILSSIYCEQGKYDQANSALEQAMAIMLDAHSADDKAMAPFFVDIAKLNLAKGNLTEAQNYYDKAMLLINNSYGPDHLYTANVSVGMTQLFILQEKFVQAEKLIDRAITVQEKFYGPEHHLIAASWLIKAKICQVKGDTAQVELLINKALLAVEKTGNTAAFAKLQQDVEEIRVGKLVAYAPLEKSIE